MKRALSEHVIRRTFLRVQIKLFVRFSHLAHRKRMLHKPSATLRDTGEDEWIGQLLSQILYVMREQNIIVIEEGNLGRKVLAYCTRQAHCHGFNHSERKPFE